MIVAKIWWQTTQKNVIILDSEKYDHLRLSSEDLFFEKKQPAVREVKQSLQETHADWDPNDQGSLDVYDQVWDPQSTVSRTFDDKRNAFWRNEDSAFSFAVNWVFVYLLFLCLIEIWRLAEHQNRKGGLDAFPVACIYSFIASI